MASIPPSSSPPEQPAPNDAEERPLSAVEATVWAFTSVIVLQTLVQLANRAIPGIARDTGAGVLLQAVSYLLLMVGIQSIYFRKTRLSVLFATKGPRWYYYPIAAVLGLALQFPTSAIYEATITRWPDTLQSAELASRFPELPLWRQIATGVALVLVTPLIEESFFRGAIYGGLRRRHGPTMVVLATAVLFGFVHIQPHLYLPIGIVGASLAFLRHASGSLWPGVVLHGVFNGMTFYVLATGNMDSDVEKTPVWLILAGTFVTATMLTLVYHLMARGPKTPAVPEGDLS